MVLVCQSGQSAGSLVHNVREDGPTAGSFVKVQLCLFQRYAITFGAMIQSLSKNSF